MHRATTVFALLVLFAIPSLGWGPEISPEGFAAPSGWGPEISPEGFATPIGWGPEISPEGFATPIGWGPEISPEGLADTGSSRDGSGAIDL